MSIDLPHYYDRFDPTANFERHLFRAGNVLQSAELNELQSASIHRLQRVTDALMKEGDVLSGASIVINATTGETTASGGALYLRGAVRGVPSGEFTIPVVGLVIVGIYITTPVITELENPALRDPAVSFRNYQDPGAARLRIDAVWGFDGDGQPGDFYPVYRIEDGLLIGQTAPPNVDAISQLIARYGRQSAGGYYVSEGMIVSALAPTADGKQVYSLSAGVARVGGEEVVRQNALRLIVDTSPDVRNIDNEPHLAVGGDERINCDFPPIASIEDVSVLREEVSNLTHGVSGSLDIIYAPDGVTQRTSVVNIVSCVQGATTYVKGVDYQLTAGKVDWSLSPTAPEGEPGVGNTYTCTFQYRDTYVPDAADTDLRGVNISGAVAGSEVLLSYDWALPRNDLVCMTNDGRLRFIKGTSATSYPKIPQVPSGMLGLAVVVQHWDETTTVVNNATRMVPMNEINRLSQNVDILYALIAEERLSRDLSQRDLPAKKGVFADPFLNDNFRDAGLPQTAGIVNGMLTLGVEASVHTVHLADHITLGATHPTIIVNQFLRTGSMFVNPYDSLLPLPATATLSPAVDNWTVTDDTWTSPVTKIFEEPEDISRITISPATVFGPGMYWPKDPKWSQSQRWNTSSTELVGVSESVAEYLRPIEVTFHLAGFGNGELLNTVYFDGLSVDFEEVV